ncbi:hypothetical protein B0H14DRAFT_2906518, partial [Mycena olivaceomarginata]
MDDSHVLVSATLLCSAVVPVCNIFPRSRISLVFLPFSVYSPGLSSLVLSLTGSAYYIDLMLVK